MSNPTAPGGPPPADDSTNTKTGETGGSAAGSAGGSGGAAASPAKNAKKSAGSGGKTTATTATATATAPPDAPDAPLRQPIEVRNIKPGDLVMLKGRPCRVLTIHYAKTGKHGHAKMSVTGIDVLTQTKIEDVTPQSGDSAPRPLSLSHSHSASERLQLMEEPDFKSTSKGGGVAVSVMPFDSDALQTLELSDTGSAVFKRFQTEIKSVLSDANATPFITVQRFKLPGADKNELCLLVDFGRT